MDASNSGIIVALGLSLQFGRSNLAHSFLFQRSGVTTGSKGTGDDPLNAYMAPGFGFRRTWTGTDGKYEFVNGEWRTKWNNFTVNSRSRQVLTNEYRGKNWLPSNPAATVSSYTITVGLNVTTNLTLSANEDLQLQSKLLQKVKGHNFNLAVNVAQSGQLVDMVAFNLRRFGTAALALRHGDFATAARQLGVNKRQSRLKTSDLSGRWLELQYGWLPALSDTFEAAKAFESISSGPRKAIINVGLRKAGMFNGSPSPSFYTAEYNETADKYLKYEMYEEMSVPRSLGLEDPLTIAWELVPYSFVVDWFLPIGSYLENLMAIPSLKGRFLTTTVRRWSGVKWTGPYPAAFAPGRAYSVADWPRQSYNRVSMTREYSSSLTVPRPEFNLAGSLYGKRIYNAVGLAYNAFLGNRKSYRSKDLLTSFDLGGR